MTPCTWLWSTSLGTRGETLPSPAKATWVATVWLLSYQPNYSFRFLSFSEACVLWPLFPPPQFRISMKWTRWAGYIFHGWHSSARKREYFVIVLCVLVTQSCLIPTDPMGCSPPGSSIYGESQEYWSGLSCPPSGDLPDPGIEPRSPALQADSLPTEPPGKPL